MADVDSTLISNRAATPRVANEPFNDAKLKTTGVAILEVSTSEDASDELRMMRVRSNAVIHQVLLSCDAISSAGNVDIGIYRTDDDGGAVVDADHFASAQAVTSALVDSNVAHESGAYGVEDKDKPLWLALGLSADSQVWYDVVMTVTTDMGGAGTLCLEVTYVDGGA
jgi:hypothetical protein